MGEASRLRARAAEIADEVLFPAALAVDAADRVPASQLDLLAAEGFYGVAARADGSGMDFPLAAALVETFASGCLTTAFVWLQHHGPVLAAADSERPGIRETWLEPLAKGVRRAGIALAGLRSPTAPMRVRAVDGGYLLDGAVPWVTGWNMIDTLYTAARDSHDDVHFLFVDAADAPTLSTTPLELVAVQASRTVDVRFDGHFVPADRLADVRAYEKWSSSDASGSALNGFLALGVVSRCCRLLGPSAVDAELAAARAALLAGDAAAVPAARATASDLVLRATAQLTVRTGARAVLRDAHAQRLLREAAFLLVFGNRPAIRDALLARLGPAAPR
ncbi:acyl-CoA dehydrogenase family protein [Catellatospora coxensis]|uniref:acyl-CoA dehydrogenase family protein n=1 Tax=Catellatospora coxensis TaxID=310354 RepID=UPI0031D17A76